MNSAAAAQPGEQPALPAARLRQKGKGRARVVRAHDVEKAGDGRDIAQPVMAHDEPFGELVQNDDKRGQQEPEGQKD